MSRLAGETSLIAPGSGSGGVEGGCLELTPCLVWLRHAPAGLGLARVAGLPLLVRACREAESGGYGPVFVAVGIDDALNVEHLLAVDRRLAGVKLLPDGSPAAALSRFREREVVVFFGTTVWDRALTAKALVALPSGCPAKSWNDPRRGQIAFARVRAGALDQFLESPGSANVGGALCEDLDGDRVCPVLGPADVPAAERVLLRALRKPADGVFSKLLSRPVSLAITARLARTAVLPNHVTALVCALGIAAATLASRGTRPGFALAAACWWAAAIFDGCDGELARLKYLGTPLGAWMDTIVDDLSLAACIAGLAAGLARASGQGFWIACGLLGLTGFCLTYPPRWYLFARDPRAGDHQRLALIARPGGGSGLGGFAYRFKQTVVRNDFLPYFVMVCVFAGFVPVALLGLTLAMLAGVVDTALTFLVWRPRWAAAGIEGGLAGEGAGASRGNTA